MAPQPGLLRVLRQLDRHLVDTTKFPRLVQQLLEYRRRKRVRFLLSKVTVQDNMRILDVGCGRNGRSFEDYVPANWQIVGIDLHEPSRVKVKHDRFSYVQQDARDLSRFGDGEFDLAVSIGMLEHITGDADCKLIASEISRVARQYIVVVPYKYPLLEPHYGVPLFPVLPDSLKSAVVRVLNLSGQGGQVRKDPEFIQKRIRWLSNSQYRELFPDSRIHLLPTLEAIAIVRRA